MNRLVEQLSLPKLRSRRRQRSSRRWPDYARSNQFNLTQCTRWARDRLHAQGHAVSRGNVGFLVRGAAYGGCPLHSQPPPADTESRDAFITNVLDRAEAAQIILAENDATIISRWLTGAVGDSGNVLPTG